LRQLLQGGLLVLVQFRPPGFGQPTPLVKFLVGYRQPRPQFLLAIGQRNLGDRQRLLAVSQFGPASIQLLAGSGKFALLALQIGTALRPLAFVFTLTLLPLLLPGIKLG
jgi:hypothetical protein